jgi:hypothetical protein
MPKPQEVASIVAQGQVFVYWTSIEIHREYSVGVSFMTFSCAEIGNTAKGWANLKFGSARQAGMMERTQRVRGALASSALVGNRSLWWQATRHTTRK